MTITHDPLEDRIRHSLRVVAETVDLTPRAATAPVRRRRRWPFVVGAVVVGVPLSLAASNGIRSGPEYVDTIPPETIVFADDLDGDEYLVVESRRADACDQPVTGVEIVKKSSNLLGSEWSTVGARYGEPRADGCGVDTAAWLADPARFEDGGIEVGDSYLWSWSVHPDVTAVRVIADGDPVELPVHSVDGAGYAFYEVPEDVTGWTSELLVGDEVVPGSAEVQTLSRR